MNSTQTRAIAIASRIALILGGISLAVGVLAGTLNKNFLNGPTLIKHVENIRMDPQVTDALTDSLTNKIVSQAPQLEPARPIIHSVANTVVTSDALRPMIKNLLRQVRQALVTGKQLQVEYGEVAGNLVTTVNKFFPNANIPTVTEMKAQIPTDGAIGAIMKIQVILKAANTLGTYLPIAAIIFFILFVAISPNRNKAVGRIGIAVLSAGFSLAVFTALLWAGVLFVGRDPGVAPYSTAIWNEFLPTFIMPAVLLMFAGAIWTAILGGILPNIDVIASTKFAWAQLWTRPKTALGTTARGLLVLAAGIFVIQQPLTAIKTVVLLAAILLILIGVFELNRLIERKGEETTEPADPAAKWIVPGLAVATLVGIIGYLMLNATAASTDAANIASVVSSFTA